MQITKPKSKHGIYCDLCKQQICKYKADFKVSGGIYIQRFIDVVAGEHSIVDEVGFDVCSDCAKEITIEHLEDKI